MPGSKNDQSPRSDYLTQFSLYSASVAAAQNVNDVTSLIDLRDSISGGNNSLIVVLDSANTTATATVSVYVRPYGGSIDKYILLASSPATQPILKAIRFDGLLAGVYKVVLTAVATGPVSVHVAHSDMRMQSVLSPL